MVENLPGPDDLVVGPDQSLYYSDIVKGTINRIFPDNKTEVLFSGLSEPEGMVITSDGRLLIAEQGLNRIISFKLDSKELTTLIELPNKTGKDGVDGISIDATQQSGETIIIPDSPNGQILRVNPIGKIVGTIASNLNRPTGAWVEPDGNILVVDENQNQLFRILKDGKKVLIAAFSTPDDVIEDSAGNIFVNTLGDHAIYIIPVKTGKPQLLSSNFVEPQGIALDKAGNIIVADTGSHKLLKIIIR